MPTFENWWGGYVQRCTTCGGLVNSVESMRSHVCRLWKPDAPTEPGLYLVLWNNQDYAAVELSADDPLEDDAESFVVAHYGPIPKPPEGL